MITTDTRHLTTGQRNYYRELVADYLDDGYARDEAEPLAVQIAQDAYWL